MIGRTSLVSFLLVASLGTTLVSLADAEPSLRGRIEQLSRSQFAESAQESLQHATRALNTADQKRIAGDPRGAKRADGIARSALALAEARIKIAESKSRLRAARYRRDEEQKKLEKRKAVLKAARAKREAK